MKEATEEAERKVQAFKDRYNRAIKDVEIRENEAEEKIHNYNSLIKNEQTVINKAADKKIKVKIDTLEKEYRTAQRSQDAFCGLLFFFCIFLECLIGANDKVFFRDLWKVMKKVIFAITDFINSGNGIGDIVFRIGVILLVYVTIYALIDKYKKYLEKNDINIFDRLTEVYSFIVLSFFLFIGGRIKAPLKVNLFIIYLVFMIGYFIIRSIIQMKDTDIRREVIINIITVIAMIAIIIFCFTSCVSSLKNITARDSPTRECCSFDSSLKNNAIISPFRHKIKM